jgi:hypothetical protein
MSIRFRLKNRCDRVVSERYQSHVDRSNTRLARGVIFSNQNYFYSTLFEISILQLIFALCIIFSSTFTIHMANDGRCNCNNGDNNDVESPPSTLEQLLIVQAQFLQTVQQFLVQMQGVNQLMQSLKARPSSRKRKSNTHDDPGKAQKINATKEAIPNHNGGSTTCFKCGKVGYFAHRCSKTKEIKSATIVDRRVTLTIHTPTHIIALL